jgi:hypothetical protein
VHAPLLTALLNATVNFSEYTEAWDISGNKLSTSASL